MTRRLLVAGTTLALALPGAAVAHQGGHGTHHRAGVRSCEALRQGHAPKKLSADQVAKIVAACDTRDAALKTANETFRAAVKSARDTFKSSGKTDADRQTRRTAIRAARKAHRQAVHAARKAFREQVRAIVKG